MKSICQSFPITSKEFDELNKSFGKLCYYAAHQLQKMKMCLSCSANTGKLKTCDGCKMVCYCSSECQRKDWFQHKTVCRVIQCKPSK